MIYRRTFSFKSIFMYVHVFTLQSMRIVYSYIRNLFLSQWLTIHSEPVGRIPKHSTAFEVKIFAENLYALFYVHICICMHIYATEILNIIHQEWLKRRPVIHF